MKNWVADFFAKTRINEVITRENRRKLIIRYILAVSITLMCILTVYRFSDWLADRNAENTFFLVSSTSGITLFVINLFLNEKNHTRIAGLLLLCTGFLLCLTAYPMRNIEQVLLYLALPTAASSFIYEPNCSLKSAIFGSISLVVIHLLKFQNELFPFLSILVLFLIAIIFWQVSSIILRMNDELISAYDGTIAGWSQAMEMRNQETEGHSYRVAGMTMQLVKYMGINEMRWEHIHRGVLLHDIGKMGVPDAILCKPGPLTTKEMEVMHSHPKYALDLLSAIPYLQPALVIPYCHHERWDGTGYPRGLKGEEIPLEARIFSVIDVWDAMRSKRSYRAAIPDYQVIDYLRSESGRSFDPVVIKAFFKLMNLPLYVDRPLEHIKQKTSEVKVQA